LSANGPFERLPEATVARNGSSAKSGGCTKAQRAIQSIASAIDSGLDGTGKAEAIHKGLCDIN
jgi:hypothetical protein